MRAVVSAEPILEQLAAAWLLLLDAPTVPIPVVPAAIPTRSADTSTAAPVAALTLLTSGTKPRLCHARVGLLVCLGYDREVSRCVICSSRASMASRA